MQFNRNAAGIMEPLPRPSIDTGAGLERIVSLKMDVDNVFETDLLRGLIAQVEQVSGVIYNPKDLQKAPAFHVIADHLRCLSFAIADGAQPSNVDRGYVLRKVLRRAVRYGKALGMEEPFLAKVLPRLIETMGEDYSELKKSEGRIAEILTGEEEAFIRTLRRGGNILSQTIEHAHSHAKRITGDEAFKLKDTYGLPLEEILLLAKDNGLDVDLERYQALEIEAKERSRKTQKTTQQMASENLFADLAATEFVGFSQHSALAKITGLVVDGQFVDKMEEGDEGLVLVDKTPFYAEMGGQVGDIGLIKGDHLTFKVSDCLSPYKGIIVHSGKLESGTLALGTAVSLAIDLPRHQKIANNHTATHLLHWALHEVLGEHIKQAGSVVDAQRLRFDFSHHKALTAEEIRRIEDLVNGKIRENLPVKSYELPYEEAQKRADIKQFFGEKYGSKVRVIDIDYSKELCGGTHTSSVGNIGLFRIAKESSIAAGVRRIEAVTGEEAEALSRQSEETLSQLAELLKTVPTKLNERIEKLLEENKQYAQELKQAKKGQLAELIANLISKAETINNVPLIAAELNVTAEELRLCADDAMEAFKSGVLVLGTKTAEDKCSLIARVSEDLVAKGIKALDIIKAIAPIVEGSGGGKANSAQAGGKAPHKMKEAIAKTRELF